MKTHHTSKKVGAVASLGVALAVGFAAHAENPETLGLWTFDGVSGTPVAEGLTDTLIPNKVTGADEVSLYLKFPASFFNDTATPEIYTNEVQGAYLFGDPNFTNLLATCASSLFVDTKINNGNTVFVCHVCPFIVVNGNTLNIAANMDIGNQGRCLRIIQRQGTVGIIVIIVFVNLIILTRIGHTEVL